MNPFFSFIIPVYNRPEELSELINSLISQNFNRPFEIVVIEDGSSLSSEAVIEAVKKSQIGLQDEIVISYYKKNNSGPGDSRNYGMRRAKGDYFIVLDSDCIVPPQYLGVVDSALEAQFVHCYGGPDAAHESFSMIQKAINYAMTSVLTTGGIRGNKRSMSKFQPRSFNMGISKELFLVTNGFGKIHPGEDPDLTFRIWEKGYETRLIDTAFVYHKRRIDWQRFYKQVKKFGMVRPILNKWHPNTAKMTYWFPTLFMIGSIFSLMLWVMGIGLPLYFYMLYFLLIFIDSLIRNRSIAIALLSLLAVGIQFTGYGFGFLKSTFLINFNKKKAEDLFPDLFFKTPETK